MRVVIIGAGIGGLALAQALRQRGVDVSIHDRDQELSRTGGYRLHLDQHACAALRRGLPAGLYQALLASSAGSQAFLRFSIADHRMRVLAERARDREEETLLIGRVPLRRLLTYGLGEALHLGSDYTHHHVEDDGTVVAHFADGRVERADLLVGADGVGSRVVAALAGGPTSWPTGFGAIAGRAILTPDLRVALPALLREGPALAFDPSGFSVFLHVHDPGSGTVVDPASCVAVPADLEPADIVWGINADVGRLPSTVRHLDAPDLQQAATALLTDWHPGIRAVAAAPVRTIGAFRFHSADPDGDLTPWPSGPVTALGDAVHAMPPTGGRAAATAIRDADLLAHELDAVLDAHATVPLAVHAYERTMPTHAAPAIRTSLSPLAWQRRLARPVGHHAARLAFPTLALAHRLRSGARS